MYYDEDDDLYSSCLDEERMNSFGYRNDERLKEVWSGDEVTRICGEAFYCCSNLEWIEVPKSLVEIGKKAFCCCFSLLTMALENVKIIGDGAFSFCSSLNEVDTNKYFPHLEVLGDSVFEGCSMLKKMTLHKSIKQIGNYVFKECGGDSGHFKLSFYGTMDEFRNVKLAKDWNTGSTIEKIVCTDGDLYIRKPKRHYLTSI